MEITQDDRFMLQFYTGIMAGIILSNDLEGKLNDLSFSSRYDDIMNAIARGEEITQIK